MRYLIGVLVLAVLLSCAAPQPRQTVERRAAAPTPTATLTPTPLTYEDATGGSPTDARNELPGEARRVIDRAEKLEVILINPAGAAYHPNVEYKLNSQDRYYGYEVLGKAVVSGAKARALRDSLHASMAAVSTGESAMCFYPQHGLRATHKGKTAELLICFHCMNLYTYTADRQRHPPMNAISRGAQQVFNRVLGEAGVRVR